MKFLVVTGGVVSGLGKGITISSMGRLLKSAGLRVTAIKIDPYLNMDAGTMSPFEHGETFVLDDGGETDLDLGNYERWLDITLTREHNITTGKVYASVIEKERRGDYLGKTVQVVPHITDEVQAWIERVAAIPTDGQPGRPDVCLVEVGGTVGDIESSVFLEALRQFQFHCAKPNFCLVHVSLVPVLGEQKTKPTQHGVKELRSVGLSPDILICRSSAELLPATRAKLGIFCHVAADHVLSVHDVANIYHVPLILHDQKVHELLRDKLGLGACGMRATCDMESWKQMANTIETYPETVTIALVGKYTGLQDSYLSVFKALKHSAEGSRRRLDIVWVESTDLEPEAAETSPEKHAEAWAVLARVDGVVVPGGFGERGVEGMVLTAKFCREQKKPYLGVCLGMQVMVIEYCRTVLGRAGANSTEFDEVTPYPTVVFMPEIDKATMGGNMRLGARPTTLAKEASIARTLYGGKDEITERHRHRYEVNPEVVDAVEAAGLRFTGKDDTGTRMEIAELPRADHPFYLGTQYHPEFKSRPQNPAPPFFGLILAASGQLPK
mmetsp:Transcript_28837/g.99375  ORF Transcript_28837/g.99375 Transcript_28837/m.99375 type:complete len:554 (+) Transcript_28837:23-1684(+)